MDICFPSHVDNWDLSYFSGAAVLVDLCRSSFFCFFFLFFVRIALIIFLVYYAPLDNLSRVCLFIVQAIINPGGKSIDNPVPFMGLPTQIQFAGIPQKCRSIKNKGRRATESPAKGGAGEVWWSLEANVDGWGEQCLPNPISHPTAPWFALLRVLDVHMRATITSSRLVTAPSHRWMGRRNSRQRSITSSSMFQIFVRYKRSRRVLHQGRNRVTLQLHVCQRVSRWRERERDDCDVTMRRVCGLDSPIVPSCPWFPSTEVSISVEIHVAIKKRPRIGKHHHGHGQGISINFE